MSKPSRQDERLLALLLENQLITENQKSRLLKAIKGKTTLAEAISRVPLVDPVKFASMQALAAPGAPIGSNPVTDETLGDLEPDTAIPAPFVPVGARDEDVDLVVPEDIDEELDLGGESFGIKSLGAVNDQPTKTDVPVAIDLDIELVLPGGETESLTPASSRPKAVDDSAADNSAVPNSEATTLTTVDLEFMMPDDDSDFMDDDFMLPEDAQVPAPPQKAAPASPSLSSDDFDLDFDMDFDVPAEAPPAKAAFKPSDALDVLDEVLGPDSGGDVESRRPSSAGTDTIESELGEFFDEAFSSKTDVKKPEAAKAPAAAPAAAVSLASLPNFDALPPMRPFSDYEKPGVQAQTFDLAKDDGLDLIRDVNAVLTDALDTESSGLVADGRAKSDNLYFYDDSHAAAERSTLKGDPLKFINRVKAMAKIESYREGAAGKGHCNLVLDGLPRKAYVEVEKTPTGDILVMHFWGK